MAALQVGGDAGMDQDGGRGNGQVWMDSGPSTDVGTGLRNDNRQDLPGVLSHSGSL